MMKHFSLLFLLSTLFSLQFSFAQHTHNGIIRCGTMEHLEWLKQQDPGLESRMEQIENSMHEWIENNQSKFLSGKDLFITIPVVVHVVYNNSIQNIPDAMIISQIDVLNEDFRRLNADTSNTPVMFQDVAGDLEIEFCLATTDPEGNPTNGITRTQTSVTSFSSNNAVKYSSQGGEDAWPSSDYLNIWVCNLGGGLLGYAQFPGGNPLTDGVVIHYQSFGYNSPGYPYHLGRTTTHEIGHWLNLRHIWGDDGGACSGSDFVSDTPNQGSEYYGCPNFPQVSCGSEDMFMNYMDYTDDACMNIYTNGQKERAHSAINVFRSSLFASPGCETGLPSPAFTASETEIPEGCAVDFTDVSVGDPISWEWYFEGGTPETSNEQNPANIIYENEGSFMVSLTIENTAGSNTLEIEDFITVGDFLPEVDFEANKLSFCSSDVVTLSDNSTACPESWQWSFDPSTISYVNGTSASSQNPEVEFDQPGIYSVTLSATNIVGESTLTKADYLYSGGLILPFYEDFEDEEAIADSWTILNPDDKTTWEIAEVEGYEPSVQSMAIYFHDEYSVYERDQLISPVLNLSGVNYAAINFKHAYAQFNANLSDSLIMYISNDCGSSWTRILEIAEDGSGNFATADPSYDEFIPGSEDDWCGAGSNPECLIVDISPWTGGPDVQFMFESYDLYGNKLYLDDVDVSIFTRTYESGENEVQIYMFPNPAKEMITIGIQNIQEFVDVQIINLQGQVLYGERFMEANFGINSNIQLSNLTSGVYFIRFSNDGFSKTEKLIIE